MKIKVFILLLALSSLTAIADDCGGECGVGEICDGGICVPDGGGGGAGQGVPLDESAGMFAGAIVAMGAYVLYRKRKLSKQK